LFPSAVADETIPPLVSGVDPQDVQDSILQGLDWFAKNQGVDGGWSNSVGITGFIVICFANAGYDETNRTVSRALEFMRGFYNPLEGSMADSFLNYDTAISLVAMSAVGASEDMNVIEGMTDFLQYLQFGETKKMYNVTEEWYPGGWPNYAGIPDVSNSQFALLGLQAADLYTDIQVPATVWANATEFMHMCQNYPALNSMEWAHNESLPSQGDGGFVYNAYRSRTDLGEMAFESYGSITAGGLYSYLVCGNDPRQPEVAAAREWLESEYTIDHNPRMGGKGLFYYLWSLSRAMAISPDDWVVDSSGKLHDWRTEVATYFMDRQRSDGMWPGNGQIGWREEEPVLAGIYAILSMQAAYMTAPDPELAIEVEGASSVRFLDTTGRELVDDVSKGLTVTDNSLTCTDPETFRKVWVDVEGGAGGTATVTATGTWGDGRTSSTSRDLVLGNAGASAMVAANGATGPLGIHVVAFDRGPDLETVGKSTLELVQGQTAIVPLELVEASGEGPVVGAKLIIWSTDGLVADVDVQGIDIAPGGAGSLDLTISVDGDVSPGRVWHGAVVSSTAPPVPIKVKVVEPEEDWSPGAVYYVVIGAIVVLMLVFFALPRMGKPTVIDDDALEE
jgi:hypothetical protein